MFAVGPTSLDLPFQLWRWRYKEAYGCQPSGFASQQSDWPGTGHAWEPPLPSWNNFAFPAFFLQTSAFLNSLCVCFLRSMSGGNTLRVSFGHLSKGNQAHPGQGTVGKTSYLRSCCILEISREQSTPLRISSSFQVKREEDEARGAPLPKLRDKESDGNRVLSPETRQRSLILDPWTWSERQVPGRSCRTISRGCWVVHNMVEVGWATFLASDLIMTSPLLP